MSVKGFYLMNKDNIVLEFALYRDTFGVSYTQVGPIRDTLPIGLVDFSDWIRSRFAISTRLNITDLFSRFGIINIEDYIQATNCIAVTDTYWVKPVDSKKTWNSVSPYRNSLNKVISEFALTGVSTLNGSITGSPDLSTNGHYRKCWKKEGGDLYMYKTGSTGASNTGNEPFSEVFAYQLASYLGIKCTKYVHKKYKGVDVSVCKNMCTEDTGLVSFDKIINSKSTDYAKLLQYDTSCEVIAMLVLDSLLCNRDRLFENIGYTVWNDTQEVMGLAPIYDNNLSCLPYCVSDKSIEEFISSIRLQTGITFNDLYKMVKCKYSASLISRAKSFSFKPIGVAKADKRIPLLNKMLKFRVNECMRS